MDNFIAVRIGDCLCPGSPHDGDVVYLKPSLDLRGGFRVKRRLLDLNQAAYADSEDGKPKTSGVDMAELEISLAEVYLDEGIADWNLVDEEGQPRPLTPETLREHLFSDYSRAEVAADKADDLYRPAVLDPLFQRALSSLPATSTKGSTLATNGNGSKRPKRSKRSSIKSIPMDATVEITASPGGVSST
jgi:hypothetical protein